MDDFRKVFYGVIIAFIVVIVGWVSFVTLSGCGFSLNNCNASVPIVSRTSIPSLVPATLPISTHPVAPTATHFMSLAPTQIALASSTPINLVSSSLTGTPPSGVSGNTASVTSNHICDFTHLHDFVRSPGGRSPASGSSSRAVSACAFPPASRTRSRRSRSSRCC